MQKLCNTSMYSSSSQKAYFTASPPLYRSWAVLKYLVPVDFVGTRKHSLLIWSLKPTKSPLKCCRTFRLFFLLSFSYACFLWLNCTLFYAKFGCKCFLSAVNTSASESNWLTEKVLLKVTCDSLGNIIKDQLKMKKWQTNL